MKQIILFLTVLLPMAAQSQTELITGKNVRATLRFILRNDSLETVSKLINSSSTHKQTPTAKAVYDYGQSLTVSGGSVASDATIDGDGTGGDPLKIAQQGATSGQVLKWNGTTWLPAADDGTTYTGGTGIDVTGTVITNTGDTNGADDITTSTTAGGDLSGTYPSPTVDGLQTRPVASTAPSSGQVLKWDGSQWAPANDNVGSVTTNDLVGAARLSVTNGTGAVLGASPVTIDIAQNGATSGQVLKWDGSAWSPAADAGTTYTAGTGIDITGTVVSNTGDLSNTNEAQTLSVSGTSTGIISLNAISGTGGGTATIAGAGINSVSQLGGTITITGTEVDGSVANEGTLGVGAGSGTSSVINSNTSGATGVTINASTGLSITESTSSNGGSITLTNSAPDQTVAITGAGINVVTGTYPNFTITGTEVDGSTTNELQTVSNTSNATSHTVTLSNSGGSVQLVEGTGVGLATTGTTLNGVVTVTNTAPDQTVSITGAGISNVTGTYPNFTVTSTEVDGSTTNELQTISVATNTVTLSNAGGSVTIAGAGINSVGTAGSTITVTGTEVDGSTTNELQTVANTSDATTHTVTLSNSGGSIQLAEGTGIGLATTGTSLNGVLTVTNTGDTNAADDITTSTSAGGDLNGTFPNPTVDGLQGVAVSGTAPTTGQVLKYNGSVWIPDTDNTGGGGLTEPAGQVVVGTGSGADSYSEYKYLTTPNDLQLLNTSGANNANLSVRTTDTTGIISTKSTEAGKVSYYADDNATTGNSFVSLQPTGQTLRPNLGPFNINGRLFPGVNAPFSSVPNYVYNIGYNYANNTSREKAHEPAIGLGFETFYMSSALASGSTGFTEFHIRMTDTFDVEHRFMTAVMPWDGQRGKSDVGFLTDNFYFNDYANSPVWSHNPLTNLWNFSDTTTMRFGEPRGFGLTVLNGAGTAYMDVLEYNNEDTLSIGGSGTPGIKLQNDVVFTNSRLFPQSGVTQFDIGSTARPSALYVTGRGFFDSRVQILNNYSSTSVASNDNFNNVVLRNTNATDNNWSSVVSYNNTGTIASSIGFQHISQTNAYDEIAFHTRSAGGFAQRFRVGATNTSYMPFVTSSTFTASGPVTFNDISTINGIPTFNASPVFNTTVNVGSASVGSRLNVVNDYSSTSVASSNAYTALQISNRNTTNNNWSAIEFAANGAFGAISSDIAAQFTNHSSLYSDLVFHVRTDGGFQEAMRIKGGVGGRKTGINNASPAEALDVTGNIRASGQAGTGNRLLQADANGTQVRSSIDPATIPTASGTTNTLAKFTGANTLGNSRITDNGNDIAINNSVANTTVENTSASGYIVLQTAFQSLTIDNLTDQTFFVDNSATPKGMQYDQDYSATFATHSMISKKYADEHLASRAASTAAPSTGDVMKWNGSAWAPAADATGGGGSLPSGTSGQTVRYDGTNTLVATSALTNDGTTVAAADMNLSGKVALSGDISPSDLTADVNDYNPTSLSSSGVIYISSDADMWHITGLQGGSDGRMITFINDGSYPYVFPPEHAGSTAANRFAGFSDVVCYPGKAVAWIYDATASRWRLKEYAGEYDFSYGNFVGRNWSAASITAGDWGDFTLYSSGTGAGSTSGTPTSSSVYSFVSLSTGSTSTGVAGVAYSKTQVPYWGANVYRKSRARVIIPTLSTSTERFITYFRESTAISQGAIGNNQWGFRYSDDVNGGEWQAFTRNNAGAESTLDCNVAVTAGAIYNLEMVLNKTGTECRFFINDTYVGAITGNMPTWTSGFCPQVTITKTVGTTARTTQWMTGSNLFMY